MVRRIRAIHALVQSAGEGIARLAQLVCWLVLPAQALGAHIGICEVAQSTSTSAQHWDFYDADGKPRQLVVSDDNLDPRPCEAVTLPIDAGSVLWASPLPAHQSVTTLDRLMLLGIFTAGNVTVSEVIGNEPQIASANRPALGRNLLENFEVRQFGSEERAVWEGGRQLSCEPGTRVAGLQLQTQMDWPGRIQLQIIAAGTGSFDVAIADRNRIDREAPLKLGTLAFGSSPISQRVNYELPVNAQPWEALTLLCPFSGGVLDISLIILKPINTNPESQRSAWVWNPETWQNAPEFFWSLQSLEDINEFFITVPVTANGTVAAPQTLRNFISAANLRGLRIRAAIGDRDDVLPSSLPALGNRITAYRHYNESVPAYQRLAGVQLDIEPYRCPVKTWQGVYGGNAISAR